MLQMSLKWLTVTRFGNKCRNRHLMALRGMLEDAFHDYRIAKTSYFTWFQRAYAQLPISYFPNYILPWESFKFDESSPRGMAAPSKYARNASHSNVLFFVYIVACMYWAQYEPDISAAIVMACHDIVWVNNHASMTNALMIFLRNAICYMISLPKLRVW